ncbi:MAG: DUF1588 domain-containing protein [Sandaracinaceae bacterium]|nr:DUF1588 domain-containing protein [Sandaracinaceae bacterium]
MLRLHPCAVVVLLLGCEGYVLGGPLRPGDDGVGSVDDSCETPRADTADLEHLTRAEYERTVRDLLGVESTVARGFAPDENTDGYEVGSRVAPLLAEQYVDAAESLSERAVTENLAALVPCDPASGDEACARAMIDGFGRRAYRRSLTDDERDRLLALFRAGAAYDFATGIRAVIMGALASPAFLYHVELAPPDARAGTVVPLDAFALANRLSYFLWGTMPDDELLDAAERGTLDVEAQARRMLEDERASDGMLDFARQWLSLDHLDGMRRDATLYPEFGEDAGSRLRASIEAFLQEVFRGDSPTVDALLLGSFGYFDAPLAATLGIPGVEGEGLVRVDLDPTQRLGLLTQPALLAVLSKPNQSDPIHRGLFVRQRLLCQQLPPPPDDIAVVAPDPAPGLTTRERFAEHSTNTRCQGCHQLMDPIGFGFEHYDAMGRWREDDGGRAIDATGQVLATVDADGAFDGVPDLAAQLAGSVQVRECVALQAYRYAMGRTENTQDACSVAQVQEEFRASNYDLRELFVAIVRTDGFSSMRVAR